MPRLPIAIISRRSEAHGRRSGIGGCQNRGGRWQTLRILSCTGRTSIPKLAVGASKYGCHLNQQAQDDGEYAVSRGRSEMASSECDRSSYFSRFEVTNQELAKRQGMY